MNVVLYDVKDQRGWLVDGASALLHLSRAALTSPHAPPLDHDPSLAPVDQLIHGSGLCGSGSSKNVLLNKQNRKIILYEDEAKPWRFEDLVLEIWEILSAIRSHQAKLRSPDDKKWHLSNPGSTRLEGFGFNDIISTASLCEFSSTRRKVVAIYDGKRRDKYSGIFVWRAYSTCKLRLPEMPRASLRS